VFLSWGVLLQMAQHQAEVWTVLTGGWARSHQAVHYTVVSEGNISR